ncbi:hypothetical protein [Dactylosporangium salmoneum]|uniref:Uncharacterized protein n=1 Tax=Dactylosporangium salmoneum TaxID=53361 RepID=A0ABN3HBR7_9ACTN
MLTHRLTSAGAALAALALGLSACAGPAPGPAASGWSRQTEQRLLDLLHVTSPQSYLDSPNPAGDLNGLANAILVLRAAHVPTTVASFDRYRHGALYGDYDPLGQTALAARATSAVDNAAVADAVAQLGRPGAGFADPAHRQSEVDLGATLRALDLLDLVVPHLAPDAAAHVEQVRATTRIPDVCHRLIGASEPDARLLVRLAAHQGDQCPHETLAQVAAHLDASGDLLVAERLRAARALTDLGAIEQQQRDAIGSAAAAAFEQRFSTASGSATTAGIEQARDLLDAITDLDATVQVPQDLTASAQRLVRWGGAILDVDPQGLAVETAHALFALRVLARSTRDSDQYGKLLSEVRARLDATKLTPDDALVWHAALPTTPIAAAAPPALERTDLVLALLDAAKHDPKFCPEQAPATWQQDLNALATGKDPASRSSRLLRAAATRQLIRVCTGHDPDGTQALGVALQDALAHIGSGAGHSELLRLAEAACLADTPTPPLRSAVNRVVAQNRLTTGGAADDPAASILDSEATYDVVRLSQIAESGCSPGWWTGLDSVSL